MKLTNLRIVWENGTTVEGWVVNIEWKRKTSFPNFDWEPEPGIKGQFSFIGDRENIVAVITLEEREITVPPGIPRGTSTQATSPAGSP